MSLDLDLTHQPYGLCSFIFIHSVKRSWEPSLHIKKKKVSCVTFWDTKLLRLFMHSTWPFSQQMPRSPGRAKHSWGLSLTHHEVLVEAGLGIKTISYMHSSWKAAVCVVSWQDHCEQFLYLMFLTWTSLCDVTKAWPDPYMSCLSIFCLVFIAISFWNQLASLVSFSLLKKH